jgi:hypothetical protein
MRRIKHVVLSLGASQQVEGDETGNVMQVDFAIEPGALKIPRAVFEHLEPVHGYVHQIALVVRSNYTSRHRSCARRHQNYAALATGWSDTLICSSPTTEPIYPHDNKGDGTVEIEQLYHQKSAQALAMRVHRLFLVGCKEWCSAFDGSSPLLIARAMHELVPGHAVRRMLVAVSGNGHCRRGAEVAIALAEASRASIATLSGSARKPEPGNGVAKLRRWQTR